MHMYVMLIKSLRRWHNQRRKPQRCLCVWLCVCVCVHVCVRILLFYFFKDLDPFSLHCKLSERFIHTPIDMCMELLFLDFWSLPFSRFLLVYVFQLCLFIKWIHKQAEASSEDKVIYFKGNPHMINYLRLLGLSASVKGACVCACVAPVHALQDCSLLWSEGTNFQTAHSKNCWFSQQRRLLSALFTVILIYISDPWPAARPHCSTHRHYVNASDLTCLTSVHKKNFTVARIKLIVDWRGVK